MRQIFVSTVTATGVAAIMLAGVTSLRAQEVTWRKSVGEWIIGVDNTVDRGCFMATGYSRGTVLRIGFDEARNGYVAVGNVAWRSLEVGKEYRLAFQFDDETPWRATAIASAFGVDSPVVLLFPFTKPNFLLDFARTQSVSISYDGRSVTRLTLKGTLAAEQELVRCQLTIDGGRSSSPPSDPFDAGRRRVPSDPCCRRPDVISDASDDRRISRKERGPAYAMPA